MEVERLYRELRAIEQVIQGKGLTPAARAHVNYFGDRLQITVRGAEDYDANGFWSSEKSFCGKPEEAMELIRRGFEFAHAMPSEQDRAIELMIRKLNEMASKLPKGNSDVVAVAWKEIHKLLMDRAQRLAKNGLMSPQRIADLHAGGR